MNEYEFEVSEKQTDNKFTGTTFAKDESAAINELKEWYAMELGTVENQLKVKIKLKGED